ncbi:MAG: phosphoribosylformylglycinamidine synthase [Sulfobacillus thermosulfidooxidans]|uniref:Phosphoribosylformylglycinamidine synthase subunit PurS n=1 Tax=Sulfobacillus thermosulfidooxidans TaxID=28034 RepID=A0A2T2X164_SULTH|nr:MAG: phosphoribosylformylglycinamidine synthase [Sulfobacillus thermosulfidooxidans]
MTFDIIVNVALKDAILDPAGQSTAKVLRNMGYPVQDVRIGKQIKLQVTAESLNDAKEKARQMAEKLLANPVMETYDIVVKES